MTDRATENIRSVVNPLQNGKTIENGKGSSQASETSLPVVNVFNEWDPLEEVIVGVVNGAAMPEWHISLKATMPEKHWETFDKYGGQPFPQEEIEAAEKNLEEFVHILEAEGVTVRRPDPIDFSRPYSTQDWHSPSGLYAAMPRDVLLAIGNEIIEVPMAWRSRYFEVNAYRSIITDYFRRGAKWTAAPKPQLTDDLYNYDFEMSPPTEKPPNSVITEFEPTFDAADFIRCGKDIFGQRSQVTNLLGIEWLRRHLGDEYTVHELEVNDPGAMHIDATFMPLAPGKLLLHPTRLAKLPEMFKSWDIFYAPQPSMPDSHKLYMTSKWINMNIVMLDEERVMVEKEDEPMIAAFKDWGFKPIPCSFRHFNTFGGSFHCATLDVRRRGTLQSYF